MAPGKRRGNRAQKTRSVKNEKLASFIKDFDSQVKTIKEELHANIVSNQKEVDSLYSIELIKRPSAIRKMCWLDVSATGGSLKALEAAATVNVDIEKITSSVSHTPFKPARNVKKRKVDSIEEAVENVSVQTVQKSKANSKVSTAKKLGSTRKTRLSAANTTAKRTSKRGRPPSSKLADSSVLGYTPMVTPKINTKIFKTPALRTPSIKEAIYTFSANGSPLGGMDELFINLPAGDGKNIRLTAEDIDGANLRHLDRKAFENIKLLSSRLERICKTLK